ncbi:anti-phage protein Ppl [Photobacterium indicum]|uniref:Rad50/SbcC-type AAA domain-containing protein n=1 Tax=Photobacterium indicum TaxID=81447 RepID=A0A2T3LED5_9GAMM|nr:anti-phage protein Ppl [Photobacterium indicum]PSV49735.1 hypothetical protein C9J47_04005 [Photobacterium indicum]
MEPIGSRWFKVDFHCHSPGSDDYPKPDSQDALNGCSPEDWLLAQMAQEIDCVVLSDHNTGRWLETAQVTLQQLKDRHNAGDLVGYRDLHIIPAVELTAAGNCHVLGLFDETATGETISHVVGSCGSRPDPERGNHQTILGSGVPEVISKIHDAHGIAILAHVDKAKGIFQNTNQEEVRAAFNVAPDAIELIGSYDGLGGFEKALVKELAQVKGSDAHCRERMGHSYTWVKMATPSFEGIKVALADPQHCIIRDAEPPRSPNNKISKLTLKTRMCKDEAGNAITINLSPWYTAIVGSRGSGKSTLVEAIRLALSRDTRVNEPKLPADIERRLVDFKNTVDGAVTSDSSIDLEYNKDGYQYKLSWTPNSFGLSKVDSDSGEWIEDPTFDISRFPISIYSQKMLFDIATKPNAFLKVIDDSEVVQISEWTKQNERLKSDYKAFGQQTRELDRQLNEIPKLQGNLTDVENKLKTLETCGLSEKQQQLTSYQKKMTQASTAINTLNSNITDIKNLVNGYDAISVTEEDGNLKEWQLSVHEAQKVFVTNISEQVKQSEDVLSTIIQQKFFVELSANITTLTEEMKTTLEALEGAEISPDELDQLLISKEELTQEIAKEEALRNRRNDIAEKRDTALSDLIAHRSELTIQRKAFIDSLELTDLHIKVLPLACSADDLVSSYQNATGIDRFSSHILDKDRQVGLLHLLDEFERFNPRMEERRSNELEKLKQFHRKCKGNPNCADYDIHGALKTRISQLSDEQLDNFDCWFPDDGIDIKFSDESGNKRPLDKASPGQKSASMLTFLMSYGSDPLVLDQPEDDLDCAMLAQTVIPAISQNKQRRQLIVVTHSAPIVVNGDAEYIVGMKQNQMRLISHIDGGIQQQEVKDFICSQMEGGEKAFRSRFKRIVG